MKSFFLRQLKLQGQLIANLRKVGKDFHLPISPLAVCGSSAAVFYFEIAPVRLV